MDLLVAPKIVYRVDGPPGRGLWYSPDGKFVGEIHNGLSFCHASAMQMPYDESLVGWRSCTSTPQELLEWISLDEFARLEHDGFRPSVYLAKVTRKYIHKDPGTGTEIPLLVFEQSSATLIKLLTVTEFALLLPKHQLILNSSQ